LVNRVVQITWGAVIQSAFSLIESKVGEKLFEVENDWLFFFAVGILKVTYRFWKGPSSVALDPFSQFVSIKKNAGAPLYNWAFLSQ
jgi:hypothetical protein